MLDENFDTMHYAIAIGNKARSLVRATLAIVALVTLQVKKGNVLLHSIAVRDGTMQRLQVSMHCLKNITIQRYIAILK